MFRRKPVLRGMGRPDIPPLLQRANQLFASGQYVQAALAYEQLAERFPGRAPFLYVEAGRATILAGQIKPGMAHLHKGLTMLASRGRYQRMQRLGQRAVADLKAQGLKNEADEIASLLQGDSSRQDTVKENAPAKKAILPTHCPSCGGALRPDEVEWLDNMTAECAYCGSPVRGGK